MKITARLADHYQNHSGLWNRLLLLGWLVANLLQARFTELANDEAYYWVYASNLDFGYFDHPPAIAVLIKAGYFLFQNELGVRLFVALLSPLFIWLAFQLTNRHNFPLFFGLICSVSIFHAYGFVAVPDAPLLFFTVTLFLLHERYLEKNNALTIVLLSLNIALLLYSKYHGVLILFFILLSNLSLFRRRSFYMVILLAVLAYLPHIIWQVVNNYPSYQYHVLAKSQDPYNPMDSVLFLLGQLLVAGPLIGFLLFYGAFCYRTKTPTEKAMKYNLTGFLVFFLLSTINARVEPNWTVAAFVPLVILAYKYFSEEGRLRRWMTALIIASCALLALFRLNLALNFYPPAGSKLLPEFYQWKIWSKEVKAVAKGVPVVFSNSYQKASKYHFYSGKTGLSLNNICYRRNQYDLWEMEDELQGKTVLYLPNWDLQNEGIFHFQTVKGDQNGVFIPNFRSYARVRIALDKPRYELKAGRPVTIGIELENNYDHPVVFNQNRQMPDSLVYTLFHEEAFDRTIGIRALEGVVLDERMKTKFTLETPNKPGVYYLIVSVQNGWLPAGINSRLIRMVVK